jgi:hypothetical protein
MTPLRDGDWGVKKDDDALRGGRRARRTTGEEGVMNDAPTGWGLGGEKG